MNIFEHLYNNTLVIDDVVSFLIGVGITTILFLIIA